MSPQRAFDAGDQATAVVNLDVARDRAVAAARAGVPISAAEFAVILRISPKTFHQNEQRGLYEDFLVRPALGPKRYSGVLVARWLDGQVIDQPVPTFGRKRAR